MEITKGIRPNLRLPICEKTLRLSTFVQSVFSTMSDQTAREKVPFHPSRTKMAAMLVLFALWALLSGKPDLFHLGIGVLAVAFIVWLQRGLPAFRNVDDPPLKVTRVFVYLGWILWKMVESAFQVSLLILKGPRSLDPRLLAFRSDQPSLVNSVILANSITLTPATLVVDLQNNRFLVHALTRESAEEVLNGDMARRVAWLSSDKPIEPPMRIQLSKEDLD